MTPDTNWTFDQYERVRNVLPAAEFTDEPQYVDNLGDLADQFDVFLLDAFGVLNVGVNVVPGAPERVAALQKAGKQVFVLTNGAGAPSTTSLKKYRTLGYDFEANNVVSSRDAALAALVQRPEEKWGVMCAPFSEIETIGKPCHALSDEQSSYDDADGFLFLTSLEWTDARQAMLVDSLNRNPRPVIVGNPDIIAPQVGRFSLEPGWYAHEISRTTNVKPDFYGKPFQNVFDIALSRVDPSIPRNRIAMVGDTLHTDVLGGAAQGLQTILITDHGLFAGHDVASYIEKSGIIPNWIAKDT